MTPIRKSARGECCDLCIPGICRSRDDTVVWCHSNNYVDGKGGGLKARDVEGCYGCFECHAWYDGGYVQYGVSRDDRDAAFDAARQRSRAKLRTKGLIA